MREVGYAGCDINERCSPAASVVVRPRSDAWRLPVRQVRPSASSSCCSAAGHLLGAVRVARAFGHELGLLDLAQIIGRQREAGRGGVLLQPVRFRRSGDRNDPWFLRQQPGQRDLRRGAVVPSGDPLQQVHERPVLPPRFGAEAGDRGAEVGVSA